MDWQGLLQFALRILAVLICMVVHEMSHGLAAYCLGDPTAKRSRRLSLNPLRHIDPFGLLMMVVAGFGWAKPVMVDPRYFKNPKRGMALTALAGPVSNFILAYLVMLVVSALSPVAVFYQSGGLVSVLNFLMDVAVLSVCLGMFNLIPFPPLDGSKVLEVFLPDRIWMTILRYERYGMLLLMLILWTGVIDGPLWAAQRWVLEGLIAGSRFPGQLIAPLLH